MFGECLDMGVKFERSDAEFRFNNFSPHFPRALPAGQPNGTMFSLILWMLAHSTLSDVPFPLPNASLVNLHQPDARVSGFLVVKYPNGFNSPMLKQGIRKVLADAVEMAEAAFNVAIVYPGGTDSMQFKYSLTFSGDSPDTNATEQALIASERLSQLNASSVTTRVTELWPQLCHNESWCNSWAWTLTWMSQPELSLWSSLTTLATTKSQGCEQRDGPVRVSGSRVFSVNDIVMNSSIEEIDEWRDNVSSEMWTWWNTLKTAIPTCSWLGGQLYKDLSVHKRCWNPAAVVATVAAGGIVRLGPTASLTTAPYRVSSKSTRRWSYVGNHLVEKSGMRWIHYLPSMSMHGSFRRYGLRRSSTANTNMSLK